LAVHLFHCQGSVKSGYYFEKNGVELSIVNPVRCVFQNLVYDPSRPAAYHKHIYGMLPEEHGKVDEALNRFRIRVWRGDHRKSV